MQIDDTLSCISKSNLTWSFYDVTCSLLLNYVFWLFWSWFPCPFVPFFRRGPAFQFNIGAMGPLSGYYHCTIMHHSSMLVWSNCVWHFCCLSLVMAWLLKVRFHPSASALVEIFAIQNLLAAPACIDLSWVRFVVKKNVTYSCRLAPMQIESVDRAWSIYSSESMAPTLSCFTIIAFSLISCKSGRWEASHLNFSIANLCIIVVEFLLVMQFGCMKVAHCAFWCSW